MKSITSTTFFRSLAIALANHNERRMNADIALHLETACLPFPKQIARVYVAANRQSIVIEDAGCNGVDHSYRVRPGYPVPNPIDLRPYGVSNTTIDADCEAGQVHGCQWYDEIHDGCTRYILVGGVMVDIDADADMEAYYTA